MGLSNAQKLSFLCSSPSCWWAVGIHAFAFFVVRCVNCQLIVWVGRVLSRGCHPPQQWRGLRQVGWAYHLICPDVITTWTLLPMLLIADPPLHSPEFYSIVTFSSLDLRILMTAPLISDARSSWYYLPWSCKLVPRTRPCWSVGYFASWPQFGHKLIMLASCCSPFLISWLWGL